MPPLGHNVRDALVGVDSKRMNMRNVVRTAIAVAIVLSLGTVAYAVAETSRRPGASQIPTVITSHPAIPAAAIASVTPEPPLPTTAHRSAARPKKVARRKSVSAKQPSSAPVRTQTTAKKAAHQESREVVTPKVRDESDHDGDESGSSSSDGTHPDTTPKESETPKTKSN